MLKYTRKYKHGTVGLRRGWKWLRNVSSDGPETSITIMISTEA